MRLKPADLRHVSTSLRLFLFPPYHSPFPILRLQTLPSFLSSEIFTVSLEAIFGFSFIIRKVLSEQPAFIFGNINRFYVFIYFDELPGVFCLSSIPVSPGPIEQADFKSLFHYSFGE